MLYVWLIGGAVLIALEVVVPGGVLAPLGVGALIVALLVALGLADHWIAQFTAWFVVSLVLIVAFRFAFNRFMRGDESRAATTDEDTEAFDTVVEVVETIEKGRMGRIAFRDSTWQATCYERTLAAGDHAKLFYRDGLTWVVSPLPNPLTHPLDTPDANTPDAPTPDAPTH